MFGFSLKRSFVAKLYTSAAEAVADIKTGSTLAVGGFGNTGIPEHLIEAVRNTNVRDLTLVTNNCAIEGYGLDLLLSNEQVKRVIASFIGANKNFENRYKSGRLELEITPQGTLAEKLRAGGAGLPAFYTPTGFGTVVGDGGFPIKYKLGGQEIEIASEPKEVRYFDGKGHVFERAIKTDFALVKAWKGDRIGNLVYHGAAGNFNHLAATAAKVTIAEVEELVEVGELDPNNVHTPACYVKRLFRGPSYRKPIERLVNSSMHSGEIVGKGDSSPFRERMCRRAALECEDGMFVNIGIGIPTLVPSVLKPGVKLYMQSENGILGIGPHPLPGQEDPDLINPNKETVTLVKGGSLFNSADSFVMIRGGHLDLCILGALQVSREGDIANWIIPGKLVKGMGGAMDLVAATRTIVTMDHTAKGKPKILEKCTLPLTGKKVVDLLITELGVFDFKREGGITLIEIAEGVTLEQVQAATACSFAVASDLRPMRS